SGAVILSVLVGLAGMLWQSQRAERQRAITAAARIARQLQRAEDFFETDKSHLALATLARLLRDNPEERGAAERLINSLDQRVFMAPATVQLSVSFNRPDLSAHGTRRVQRMGTSLDSFQIEEAGTGVSPLVVTQAHAGPIRKISFSFDGRKFVTAS